MVGESRSNLYKMKKIKDSCYLVCGWETLGSSLAPHLIGNMNTHSSLAPSEPLDFAAFALNPSVRRGDADGQLTYRQHHCGQKNQIIKKQLIWGGEGMRGPSNCSGPLRKGYI